MIRTIFTKFRRDLGFSPPELLHTRINDLEARLLAAPSAEVVAFSLIVEEPGLPVDTALWMAQQADVTERLALVEPTELLRLAAKAYSEEQQ